MARCALDINPGEMGALVREFDASVPWAIFHIGKDDRYVVKLEVGPYKFKDDAVIASSLTNEKDWIDFLLPYLSEKLGRRVSVTA
jgi:hypothetical protein